MFLERKEGKLRRGWGMFPRCFYHSGLLCEAGREGEREAGRKGIHFIMSPTVNTLNIPTQIKPIFGVNVY